MNTLLNTIMNRKLKILFVPIDSIGHVNPAIGMAEVLIGSGHQVIFALNTQWKGKLTKYGIEEKLFVLKDKNESVDPAEYYAKILLEKGILGSVTPLQSSLNFIKNILPGLIAQKIEFDLIIENIISEVRPDVIIADQFICVPSLVRCGIPWVLVCSFNPLALIEDERTPPFISGLPAVGHELEWKEFRNTVNQTKQSLLKTLNDYSVSRGVEPLNSTIFINHSKYLNIYSYPLELDYTDLRPLPPNWYAFDNLMKSEKQSNFEIPVELRDKSGKLIYFSLGSMGAADVALMKRLVAILAKSKNRFIVSKGPLHTKYSLADNMFGQQSVPQIQVLPTVDLVITHGGNNSVTETFFFGKPMIVMPLFGDQFNNAQRVHEKWFGLRLDPYKCTEEELLNGIENLLNDKELNERLKTISKRIQSENSIAKLSKLIENLVSNKLDFNNV